MTNRRDLPGPVEFARLSRGLDELLELDGDRRAARLREIAAADAALGAELAALLAAAEGAGPLSGTATALGAPLFAAAEDEIGRIGERVGPFVLGEEIGRGGMGTVFAGERVEGGFEQAVAVKIVRRGLDTADVLARFASERRILARLEHPHIARLVDGGVTADGLPWFAMERIDGQQITAFAAGRGLPLGARLALFLDVAEAVAFAHQGLVVHRDIKPSNVLVDERGDVKLLDFGIAKLLGDEVDARLTRTTASAPLTPHYAAPEQLAAAGSGAVSTLTDVYQLGRLLAELVAAGGAETPRDLERIAAKASHGEPARRYPSVEALADDLRRWLDGRPIAARPDTLGYRVARFMGRHRLGVAAAATVLVALVGGLALALAARAREADAARRAEAARDFLVGLFEAADPVATRGRVPDAYELLERGQQRIESELGDRPELAAEMLETIGQIEGSLGRYPRAAALAARGIELRREVSPRDDRAFVEALNNFVDVATEAGDLDGADRALEEALTVGRRELGENDPATLEALWLLGALRARQGRNEEAERLLREAGAGFRAVTGVDGKRTYSTMNSLAVFLQNRGRFAEAEPLQRELVAWSERNRAADDPDRATDDHNLGSLLDKLDRDVEAEALLRRALAVREKMLPADHAFTVGTMRNLAGLLLQRGAIDEAALLVETALQRELAARGERSRAVAALERLRGRIALAANDLRFAATSSAAAAALWREVAGVEHASSLRAAAEAAEVRIARGELETGLDELLAVIERQRATGAPPSDRVASLTVAARTLSALGRADAALVAADEAVATAAEVWSAPHSEAAAAHIERARALARRGAAGDAAAARKELRVAAELLDRVAPADFWVRRELAAVSRPGTGGG